MRDETWLDTFEHELAAAGVPPTDRAAARVETETFLADAGESAYDHFGPPGRYAADLALALSAGSDRGQQRGQDRVEGRAEVPLPTPVVAVDGVSKSYRGAPVLREVTVEVGRGEVVVLTGPNGAGKSTLLRIVAGLERADTGTVRVTGTVGHVPQSGGLDPHLRPVEHFELFGAAAGLDRRSARQEGNRLARELGWDADAAPVAGHLSGGTAQKLSVVSALLGSPDVLLLDEPYQGMDGDSQRRFWELLWAWRDGGRSALLSSHSPDALAKASTVVEIDGLAVR